MDDDILENQVRFLERELAAARETLRDRFAMAALTGVVSSGLFSSLTLLEARPAKLSYILADAMMEARKS